jgi:hypothetical protein
MAAVDPSAGSNPLPLTVENLTTLFHQCRPRSNRLMRMGNANDPVQNKQAAK